MPKHTLVVIGFMSCKRCYLDVPEQEARRRYLASEGEDGLGGHETVKILEFDDEFSAYDVWE